MLSDRARSVATIGSALLGAAREFFTEPQGHMTPVGYRHRIEQMRAQLADLPLLGSDLVGGLAERERLGLRGLFVRSGPSFQVFYVTPDGQRVRERGWQR